MHKKNILFITHDLQCGGAEKALISLLQIINYDEYDVDLQLFQHRGLFMNQLHNKVNLLPEPENYKYFDMPFRKVLFQCLIKGRIDIIYNRVLASFFVKFEKNIYREEQIMWKYISRCLPKLTKKYDYAVGGLEKSPNYYCVEKVDAPKKIGWIHNDYDKMNLSVSFDKPYFEKLDYILTDSEECKLVLKKNFPQFANKFKVMRNIVSSRLINELSYEPIEFLYDGFKIISVGRFSDQKGYDLAIDAVKLVKDKGFDFKWIILGDGDQKNKILKQISDNELQDSILLLGIKENHYPYVKQCDVFMQTSRFEGKSISIDEAKILCKPILVTNFSTVNDQITNNVTGLISEMNPKSIAHKLIELITNPEKRNQLSNNLSKENNGTESEIEVFYDFLNN